MTFKHLSVSGATRPLTIEPGTEILLYTSGVFTFEFTSISNTYFISTKFKEFEAKL